MYEYKIIINWMNKELYYNNLDLGCIKINIFINSTNKKKKYTRLRL